LHEELRRSLRPSSIETRLLQRTGDEPVARTVTAAPAAVREKHDTRSAKGHDEVAVERVPGGWNARVTRS
jgi:hypothetical protein